MVFLILLLITFNDFIAFLSLFFYYKDLHIGLFSRTDQIGFEALIRSYFYFIQIKKKLIYELIAAKIKYNNI